MYDIIIIGAGPAGISAGIYAVSRGQRTLVLEKGQVGGIIGKVSTVTHYTALEAQETGTTFAARMKEQALAAGVEIVYANVTGVALAGETKTVTTDKGTYEARRVILANGSTPRKLGIPGESELAGKGMGMNAARDGAAYAGKNVYVVGGADGAVKEALYLAAFAKHLTIIHFEDQLGCIAEFRQKVAAAGNITLRLGSRLQAVYGQDQVERLDILNVHDGSVETVEDPGCGIFVYAGLVPNTSLYTELTLEDGYIPTNEKMETALPGVYAAGDIRVKQVARWPPPYPTAPLPLSMRLYKAVAYTESPRDRRAFASSGPGGFCMLARFTPVPDRRASAPAAPGAGHGGVFPLPGRYPGSKDCRPGPRRPVPIEKPCPAPQW